MMARKSCSAIRFTSSGSFSCTVVSKLRPETAGVFGRGIKAIKSIYRREILLISWLSTG